MENKKQVLFTGKAEKVETAEKGKRIRRTQKQIVLDQIQKLYKEKVIASVYGAELKKITACLDILQNALSNRVKITEEDVINQFSIEELQAILAKKQGK